MSIATSNSPSLDHPATGRRGSRRAMAYTQLAPGYTLSASRLVTTSAASDPVVNACVAANEAARSEHVEIMRGKLLTKALLCDVKPFCATEVLFNHEFWWEAPTLPHVRAMTSRCRTWQRDSDWPMTEPHLTRGSARARSFWDSMRLLANKTLWLHGDSIQLQMCDAALCSLMRSGVAPTPVLGDPSYHPEWISNLSARSGFNFVTTVLPNGARLLCSGLGTFQREQVEMVLPHVHVAVLNFGLHYHSPEHFRGMLQTAIESLRRWQSAVPASRLGIWREASAQHFTTGSYQQGAEQRMAPRGKPCECTPLSEGRQHETGLINLNKASMAMERQFVPNAGLGLLPFFNLTAPRYDMHRAHYCAFSGQKQPGICCDCTHFCYTPLFWDALFGDLYRLVRRSPLYRPVYKASAASWLLNAFRPPHTRRGGKRAGGGAGGGGVVRDPRGRPIGLDNERHGFRTPAG